MKLIVAVAATLATSALVVPASLAARVGMTYANDATTVTSTIPSTVPTCAPYTTYNFVVTQTYRPSEFGITGPYRVDSLSLPWSGAMQFTFTALTGATPVAVANSGNMISTDATVVRPVFGHSDAFPFVAPAGTTLTLNAKLAASNGGYFPTPALGVNTSGGTAGAPTPTYAPCSDTPSPLTEVTLPWTVTVVALSQADLSDQTRLHLSTDQRFSAGEVNALAQQALNGDLNDYLNSIIAKTKNNSSGDAQYLEQYASLLLGTTSTGYPAPV